jgi:hypothetical protein
MQAIFTPDLQGGDSPANAIFRLEDGVLKRTSFWNTTEVYSLIAGRWKIVHSHWSYLEGKRAESGI